MPCAEGEQGRVAPAVQPLRAGHAESAGEGLAQWPRRCFFFFFKKEHKILELSTLVDGMRLSFRSVLPASLPWRRHRVVSLRGIPSQAADSRELAPGTGRKELLRRWLFALELD